MASSEDFKRILELYNQEVKSRGVSIVSFCQQNGIVYSQFERWYKNRKKVKVHAVKIVNQNGLAHSQISEEVVSPETPVTVPDAGNGNSSTLSGAVLFSVTIRTTSGLSVQQSRIDYRQLCALVEKLEVLC